MAGWIQRSLVCRIAVAVVIVGIGLLQTSVVESASPKAYRRDPGHAQWHHGAFQDVKDSVRSEVRRMLHSRAEVSLPQHTLSLTRTHTEITLIVLWRLALQFFFLVFN